MLDELDLTRDVVRDAQGLYSIRVKGNNFLDALIKDGDIVLIRRQSTAEPGDLVVAHVKDQERSVIRRFALHEDQADVCLAAVDPSVPSIYARPADVIISGKVVSVIRHF